MKETSMEETHKYFVVETLLHIWYLVKEIVSVSNNNKKKSFKIMYLQSAVLNIYSNKYTHHLIVNIISITLTDTTSQGHYLQLSDISLCSSTISLIYCGISVHASWSHMPLSILKQNSSSCIFPIPSLFLSFGRFQRHCRPSRWAPRMHMQNTVWP